MPRRWSGRVAFLVVVPLAVHCLYALGQRTCEPSVLWHSVLGCFFFGVLGAKMLLLRSERLPGRRLPIVGGLVLSALTVVRPTSDRWFFRTFGVRSDDMTMGSTRRTVLVTGATGAAALLVGCGGDGGDSSEETSAPETAGTDGGAGGEELAKTADIPVGGGKVFKDEKVVVTQPEEGDFKAFSAVCTHRGCTVRTVEDGTINCVCHGSKFNITDGSVESGPAQEPLPAERIEVAGNSIRLA